MRVLIDTNIVLDVLLDRSPFVDDSSRIWEACESGHISGFITASTLTDIFYIARRTSDSATARIAVGLCMATSAISPVDRQVLEHATALPGDDFEDNVQIASGLMVGVTSIITRNIADFAHAPIAVFTPSDFLAHLS